MAIDPRAATGASGPVRPPARPEPAAPTTEAERHVAWDRALERMEMDLMVAKRLLGAIDPPQLDTWQEPQHLGDLPPHLAERARVLLDEQLRVGREIVEALGLRRRQHAFAERVHQTVPRSGAVYLDVRS